MKKAFLALACIIGVGAPVTTIAVSQREPVAVVAASAETQADPAKRSDPWNDFVSHYLTADKVAMYLSWVAYVGTIIGLAANIKKLQGKNNVTVKAVGEEVKKQIEEAVGGKVAEESKKFIPAILATQEKTNEILKAFSKVLALSQENTPESRVAILQVIEEIGNVGKELTEQAKQAVELEKAAIEEKKEEIGRRLDEIIEEYDGTAI